MEKLRVQGLKKAFQTVDGPIAVLDGVEFCLQSGAFVTLVGPTGCGKTTLLKIIDGLIEPTEGEVLVDGQVSVRPSRAKGLVFQEAALFPWRTALANVMFGLEMLPGPRSECWCIAERYLELVGLARRKRHFPSQLSGGEKQRVAVARALALEPDILLMDEPFAGLDAFTRETLQDELLEIWRKTQKTILFVTHSIEEAIYLGQRVLVMSPLPGRIQAVEEVPLTGERTPELRTAPHFNHIRKRIYNHLRSQV